MSLEKEGSKRIDVHIHIIGDENEGCYISESMQRKLWFKWIAHRLSLSITKPDEYVSQLVNYIKESPIDTGVILAYDAIYDSSGEIDPRTSLYIPNNYILRIAGEHDELLPGVSLHPDRKDALDEVDRLLHARAALIKWIPNAQGIDPSEKKYKRFYRKLSEYKLPLLSHTGFEFTMPTINQNLGDPERLRLALEEGTIVIAAHCGISYAGFSTRYMKTWLSLAREYPNLYGDLAALSTGFGSHFIKRLLKDKIISDKLVNGSDFPVPPFRGITDLLGRRNPFTRDYEIKNKIGVPDSVFRRGYQLVRGH